MKMLVLNGNTPTASLPRITFVLYLASFLLLIACSRQPEVTPDAPPQESNASIREDKMTQRQHTMVLAIADTNFTVSLADTEAARELAKRLPLHLDMTELNGNEKYANLDKPLPAKAEKVHTIEAGDLMLWGSDCLVLFYKTFGTPYSYTRLGHINDAQGLAKVVGKGNVTVSLNSPKARP